MKVVILAGGMGTRLGQMAEFIPKPMVPIGGKPILWHIMKIYSHYGFNEFVICLGAKASVIKSYFFEYEAINNDFTVDMSNGRIHYHNIHDENSWKVTLVDTGVETLKGGRIKRIEKYLDDSTNMLTYGDGLCDVDLNRLLEFHRSHHKLVTITGVRGSSRFGELDEDAGQVRSFVEKPRTSKQLINGGYMVFERGMLDYLTVDENCDFEIGALEQLARTGQVMVYKHDGNWDCMDHERDVTYLNQLWKDSKAFWKVWR